jgi:hypothetical protein
MQKTVNEAGNGRGSVTEVLPKEWVYFIYSGGLMKIGYTTDIHRRLIEIKATSGHPVELIAIVPGGQKFETTLHRMFKSRKTRGEWFRPSPEIRRFLACLDASVTLTMDDAVRISAGSCVARLEQAEAAHHG